jgi:cell division protein FtsQ
MPRVKKPAEPVARPSRLKLLLRRQRRLLRPLLWAGVALGALACLVPLLGGAGARGSLDTMRSRFGRLVDLRVRSVEIDGRANTPERLLDAALGVAPGDPILGFSVEAARARIESLSWVAHATVERRLPDVIHVSLEERAPFAVWQHDGRFVLIGRDGQVVTNEEVSHFSDLPLVVGAGAPEDAARLLDALAQQPAIRARVAASVRVGARRWNLQMRNGIVVMLPEGHAPEALARLAQMQAAHALLDRRLRVIDLRLPDRLVIRPAEPAPASGEAGTADTPPARRST